MFRLHPVLRTGGVNEGRECPCILAWLFPFYLCDDNVVRDVWGKDHEAAWESTSTGAKEVSFDGPGGRNTAARPSFRLRSSVRLWTGRRRTRAN